MPIYPFMQVDAFTTEPLAGNACAIVFDADDLDAATMQAIADREGVTQRRVAHLVDLAFLAPDIVRSIVEGRQPPTLTVDRLIKSRNRLLWSDQWAWISAI